MTMTSNYGWRTFGATLTGSYHVHCGRPSDDAFTCSDAFAWNVAAISDGLGSKPHSSTGSVMACCAVREVMTSRESISASAMLSRVHSRWVELVNASGFDVKDCEATCLFAYRKGGIIRVGRLGDGFIGVCLMNGNVQILTDPKDEHDDNETDCLDLEHDPAKWETACFRERDIMGVVMCTDGVAVKPECRADFSRDCCREYVRVSAHKAQREIASWLPGMGLGDDMTIALLLRRTHRWDE